MAESAPFLLYGRVGCHLCDDMIHALAELGPSLKEGFAFRFIDVDRSPDLVQLYGVRVPVLVAPDGTEICEYFLDLPALKTFLEGLAPDGRG